LSSIHFKNQFKKLKKTHFYIILMREKKTERDAYIRTHLHAGLWRLKAFAVKISTKYTCMQSTEHR
jgi:hypothetical protein